MKLEFLPNKSIRIDMDDLIENLQYEDDSVMARFAYRLGKEGSAEYREEYMIEMMSRLNKELGTLLKSIDAKKEYTDICSGMDRLLKKLKGDRYGMME